MSFRSKVFSFTESSVGRLGCINGRIERIAAVRLLCAATAIGVLSSACAIGPSLSEETGETEAALKKDKDDKKDKKDKDDKKDKGKCKAKDGCDAGADSDGGSVTSDGGTDASADGAVVPDEPCDGVDNDGDHLADEGYPCTAGAPTVCVAADGKPGIGTCSPTCGLPTAANCVAIADSDGDGQKDPVDAFPNDPNEQSDLDHDGIGDNADTDDDNDGLADAVDPHRTEPELEIVTRMPAFFRVGMPTSIEFETTGPLAGVAAFTLVSGPENVNQSNLMGRFNWTPTKAGEATFVIRAEAEKFAVTRTFKTVAVAPLDGASALIGPAGGTLQVTDPASPIFGARLDVPAGAMTQTLTLSMRPVDTGGLPLPNVRGTSVGTPLLLEPEGIELAMPATLTMPGDVPSTLPAAELVLTSSDTGTTAGHTVTPQLTVGADGRWRATISSFSVKQVVRNLIGSVVYLPGSWNPVDRRAQEIAVKCADKLACDMNNGASGMNMCVGYAALAKCLWNGYEQASREAGQSGFTSMQYLGSLYDMSLSGTSPANDLMSPALSFMGNDGPRVERPDWLRHHEDGAAGSGFKVFDQNDSDRTGRKDHFASGARTRLGAGAFNLTEDSNNDRQVTNLGAEFGWRIFMNQLRDGESIAAFIKDNLCENPSLPTPETECGCGERSGALSCCEPDPAVPASECLPRLDSIETEVRATPPDLNICPTSRFAAHYTTIVKASGKNFKHGKVKGRFPRIVFIDGNVSNPGGMEPIGGFEGCGVSQKSFFNDGYAEGPWAYNGVQFIGTNALLTMCTPGGSCNSYGDPIPVSACVKSLWWLPPIGGPDLPSCD